MQVTKKAVVIFADDGSIERRYLTVVDRLNNESGQTVETTPRDVAASAEAIEAAMGAANTVTLAQVRALEEELAAANAQIAALQGVVAGAKSAAIEALEALSAHAANAIQTLVRIGAAN